MYQVVVCGLEKTKTFQFEENIVNLNSLYHLCNFSNQDSFYFTENSKICKNEIELQKEFTFLHVNFRILGGKGGFGASLRGQGMKQSKKKQSNFNSCRDLEGNRIRDVVHQKELSEWEKNQEKIRLEQAQQKEKEKNEKRVEKEQEQVKILNEQDEKLKRQEKVIINAVAKCLEKQKKKGIVKQEKTKKVYDELD